MKEENGNEDDKLNNEVVPASGKRTVPSVVIGRRVSLSLVALDFSSKTRRVCRMSEYYTAVQRGLRVSRRTKRDKTRLHGVRGDTYIPMRVAHTHID